MSKALRIDSTIRIGKGQNVMKTVTSKKGIFKSLQLALIFVMGIGGLYMTLESLHLGSFEVLPHALMLPFFIWALYLSLSLFSSQYLVNLTDFRRKGTWSEKRIEWHQVKEVWVLMNYFGGYNVALVVEGQGRHTTLFTSFLRNQKEVTQAIMEAATKLNPQVALRGQWRAAYGTPPFGIFDEIEKTLVTR